MYSLVITFILKIKKKELRLIKDKDLNKRFFKTKKPQNWL